MKATNSMGAISISEIKAGNVFWECESGQDTCYVAVTGAVREGQGFGLWAIDLATKERHHYFEADRPGQGRLCLYDSPQYTRPDWGLLMDNLAGILQAELAEIVAQGREREKDLSLAATQYSESRDKWFAEAQKAQDEIARLNRLIDNLCDIASQKVNGITMGQRLLGCVAAARSESEGA